MTLADDWFQSYNGLQRETEARTCGTMAHNQVLMEQFPVFRRLLSDLESETAIWMSEPQSFAGERPLVIPVVVHVVWNLAAENISDAQIRAQVDVLNADYSATNPDRANIPMIWQGLSLDSGVRFRLANRDPGGQPHSGIIRVQTTVAEFLDDNVVKYNARGGSDAWPPASYLNLWVCNLGGGLLGYAQFPGGPPDTDGVVIRYSAFGIGGATSPPYNMGRTATHEVGHWLNLRHIWGDTENCSGSDFVADTPNQRLPNYGAPTFPHLSCNNGPNGDMFMNYMDYVNDAAMFIFTSGQAARMQAALSTIRTGLAVSTGLV